MMSPADTARRLPRSAWRTSSRSQTANCVEVAALTDGTRVAMRDSKDPAAAVLVFGRRQWLVFLTGIRRAIRADGDPLIEG